MVPRALSLWHALCQMQQVPEEEERSWHTNLIKSITLSSLVRVLLDTGAVCY